MLFCLHHGRQEKPPSSVTLLDALEAEENLYLPVHLNFERYVDTDADTFYPRLL